MNISDPDISRLSFGANPLQFGIMEFSPSSLREEVNLINFSGEELHAFLNQVKSMLNERYGMEVSFSNCTFKEMELNTTFALEHPFTDYYRSLSIMFKGMPYLKTQDEYNKDKEKKLQSYSKFNNQIWVIAYNKSLELAVKLKHKKEIHIVDEDSVVVKADLMRLEFKLKTAELCKKWLNGLSTVAELKGEMIDEAFEGLVDYYFFAPHRKWETKNRHFLNRIVKTCIEQIREAIDGRRNF